jgi:hypothetical protein
MAMRSHNCGELNSKNIGSKVTLCGWVSRSRDLGGMTFIDLRDRYGITQLVFNYVENTALCESARKLGREFVIQAKGKGELKMYRLEVYTKDKIEFQENLTPPDCPDFTEEQISEADKLEIWASSFYDTFYDAGNDFFEFRLIKDEKVIHTKIMDAV